MTCQHVAEMKQNERLKQQEVANTMQMSASSAKLLQNMYIANATKKEIRNKNPKPVSNKSTKTILHPVIHIEYPITVRYIL